MARSETWEEQLAGGRGRRQTDGDKAAQERTPSGQSDRL
jgi:hypothetical protein